MSKEKHNKVVEELKLLEDDLIVLISKTDIEELQDKFLDWQKKRNEANKLYLKWLNDAIEEGQNHSPVSDEEIERIILNFLNWNYRNPDYDNKLVAKEIFKSISKWLQSKQGKSVDETS